MPFTSADITAAQGAYLVSSKDPRIAPGLDLIKGTVVVVGGDGPPLFLQKQSISPTDWALFTPGGGSSSIPVTDVLWVDGNRTDVYVANGSQALPYLTIQAALTRIGSAASSVIFQAALNSRWTINVAPGIYTESLTIPSRQVINFNLQGVKIIGNVAWTYDGDIVAGGGPIDSPKVAFIGTDLRSGYNDGEYALSSIVGNITIDNSSTAFAQPNFYLLNYSVDGNITTSNTGTGDYIAQIMGNNFMLSGNVICTNTTGPAAHGRAALYYWTSNSSGAYSAGGAIGIGNVPGNIGLSVLNDVRFTNPVKTNNNAGGRWFQTFFPAGSNFTGAAGVFSVDSSSYASYKANVTPGGETFSFLDNTSGIKYVPAVPGNWPVVPATAQAALDALAASGTPSTVPIFTVTSPIPVSVSLARGDATGGSIILTLPSPAAATHAMAVKKVDASANTVTVATPSGLIDGAATNVLVALNQSVLLVSDGVNWNIIG